LEADPQSIEEGEDTMESITGFADRVVPGHESDRANPEGVTNEQAPLPNRVAARALIGCYVGTVRLLARRRLHLPSKHAGMRLRFADGTSARVFRETVVDGDPPADPCVLLVAFRLRAVRGRGHALFRRESLLNTPLFVGFRGFVSKLWVADDERGFYRGLYEWDGPARAEYYARCLWRVLAPVCVPGSIHYRVLPGRRRDELLAAPDQLDAPAPEDAAAWWRLAEVG
jgi:hypothetical protein